MSPERADKPRVPLRRKSRELALQVLYQAELAGIAPGEAFDTYIGHFDANKRALEYARRLVLGVEERLASLDSLLQQQSENWRLGRMAVID
ncbi:MAG TPA: transcription antitermination protein NusB, partial [Desulfobacterales bacterium]|nr:transcription antitermination protein NusB [Desulfobacterales bacterium]